MPSGRRPGPGLAALPHHAKRQRRPELLTIGELTELDLATELVVLSACQSLGEEAVEGDWLNGLTRAFLVAGSSGVLCTTMDTADAARMSTSAFSFKIGLAQSGKMGYTSLHTTRKCQLSACLKGVGRGPKGIE